jgi:hypothetical protein
MLYRTLTPANISVNYYKYLYYANPENNIPLFFLNDTHDYSMYGMRASFYRNPGLKPIAVDSISQIDRYLQTNKPASIFLLHQHSLDPAEKINGYKIDMVYSFFPSWISKFNFNHWEERTTIWSVYKITKSE